MLECGAGDAFGYGSGCAGDYDEKYRGEEENEGCGTRNSSDTAGIRAVTDNPLNEETRAWSMATLHGLSAMYGLGQGQLTPQAYIWIS